VTTRRTPQPGDRSIKYISPSGNDTTGNGLRATPYKTLGKAASVAGIGGTIILLDGEYTVANGYDFHNQSSDFSLINNWDGTAAAYNSIRAENKWGAVISGKLPLSGTWNASGTARVYYHTLTGFTETGDATRAPFHIRRERLNGAVDPQVLHCYGSIADLLTGTWGEGFCIDWANGRIYVRKSADEADVAPTTNPVQYNAAGPFFWLFAPVNMAFCIVDGIHFDMSGQVDRNGVSADDSDDALNSQGVIITGCTDFVFRNCKFTQATVRTNTGNSCDRLTFEDCEFEGWDPWAHFSLSPNVGQAADFFNEIYSVTQLNKTTMLAVQNGGANSQLVVRRCTFTAGFEAISVSSGSGMDASDYYENTISEILANCLTADGSVGPPVESGSTNSAAWNNTFDDFVYGVSLSPFGIGPFWVISNTFTGYINGPFRKGPQQLVDDPEDGMGWTFFYHNLTYTAYAHEGGAAGGLFLWGPNISQGNSRYANNIRIGTGDLYMTNVDGVITWPETDPDVSFVSDSWYTTAADPEWRWDQDEHETEEIMAGIVPDAQLIVTGNQYGVNPYLSGFPGPLNPAINAATAIPGITNVLADPNGMPFGSRPIPRGVASGFSGTSELSIRPRSLLRAPNNRCPRLAKQMTGRVAIV
jgi:hypothetical protein